MIFGVAASVPAASNYRPLRGDAYPAYRADPRDAGDSVDSLDQEFHRSPVRELRRERPSSFGSDRDRFDLPFRPEFDRADFNRHPSAPVIRENRSDSFGLVAPRWRDAVDWSDGPFERERFNDGEGAGYRPLVPRENSLRRPEFSAPQRRNRAPRPHVEDRPDPQELISRRYQDPAVLRFVSSLSPEQVLSMYAETLQLIESRHLDPPDVRELVGRGVSNLVGALRNSEFLEANRVAVDPQQAEQLARMLAGRVQQMPLRSAEDAVAALQVAMQLTSESLHVSPVVAGIEFEYGAIEALDRFSAFVPPETARLTNQQLGESLVGIGVQIEAVDRGARIQKVISNGPAQQAGLQAGDIILAVDDQNLAGRDLEAASELLSGPAGAGVRLTIARDGGAVAQVSLSRRSITLQSVSDVQILEPEAGVAYMKLETFASNSTREMEQALWSLQQQGMKSLILDLRGDPGGLLTTAVEVADLFLPDGTIVSTRGRMPSDNTTETASHKETWKVPLVVLVDENSASASEILAAAIQENGRGTIVGRHTYGKGTVQTLFPLRSVSAGLRLTTAKFYSPSGREMAGAGVEPDVSVPAGRAAGRGGMAGDRDLQTALQVALEGVADR